MSIREIAYSIFQQFSDEELEGFVLLFGGLHPPVTNDKKKAFAELEQQKTKFSPPIDDDREELARLLREKYDSLG